MLIKTGKLVLPALTLMLVACGGGDDASSNDTSSMNQAPIAGADAARVKSSVATEIAVLSNDSDPDGDVLALAITAEPEHGTASVSGDVISYQSTDGYLGSDSLSYEISDGSDSASATLDITVYNEVALQGQVTDSPIANATVVITIDGEEYTTTADAEGNFTLPVQYVAPDALVVVHATGSADNNQQAINFTSYLDTTSSLQAMAGDDGVLSAEENNEVNVTHVTTAKAKIIERAAGGEITDATVLNDEKATLVPDDVFLLAAVIQLIVDDPNYTLPSDYDKLSDFLESDDAVSAFVEQVNNDDPELLENKADDIQQAESASLNIDESALVGTYTWAIASRKGLPMLKSSTYAQDGTTLQLKEDHTGLFFNAYVQDESLTPITWELTDSNNLVVTFVDPTIGFTMPYKVGGVTDNEDLIAKCGADTSVLGDIRPNTVTFKLLDEDLSHTVVEEFDNDVAIARPLDCGGETVELGVVEEFNSSVTVALRKVDESYESFTPEQLPGQWVFPIHSIENGVVTTDADTVTFADDGNFNTAAGVSGTWMLSDDNKVLELDYPAGTQRLKLFGQQKHISTVMSSFTASDKTVIYVDWAAKIEDVQVTADDVITGEKQNWLRGYANSGFYANAYDTLSDTYAESVLIGLQLLAQPDAFLVSGLDADTGEYRQFSSYVWSLASESMLNVYRDSSCDVSTDSNCLVIGANILFIDREQHYMVVNNAVENTVELWMLHSPSDVE
ncbi:hypothetical protein CWI84_06295 [Idiomarina tyrosinivorans]|uniref:Cadherin-like domain-containing protein n=1 Tax=Idiomarina tyrosinivorans TaxID=1445662 RepID=A0A432ZQX5_9GAMM|nr:Ig-like domain-containing protein [Idiomarina tyrosinivorans]RUO80238.1 hypothetical protein CWI84_06295 [Idiomarina tyrosinivorans]